MASGLLNDFFLVVLLASAIMVASLFVEAGPAAAGDITLLSALHKHNPVQNGDDLMVGFHGDFHRIISIRIIELYRNSIELAYQRNDHVPFTVDHLGILCYRDYWSCFFPVLLSAALLLIMEKFISFFLSDIFIQGEVLHYQLVLGRSRAPFLVPRSPWSIYRITSSTWNYFWNHRDKCT